jgi:hypothetical protein
MTKRKICCTDVFLTHQLPSPFPELPAEMLKLLGVSAIAQEDLQHFPRLPSKNHRYK